MNTTIDKNHNTWWKFNILKTWLVCIGLAVSLSSAMAQTDTAETKLNNKPEISLSGTEKFNHDMIKSINLQREKLDSNNYETIISNIKQALTFAYDVKEDKIYIKRGVVPYKIEDFFGNIKDYTWVVLYFATDITLREDWKLYVSVKWKYVPKN